MNAIVITESVWANSQMSIARYYGRIKCDGFEYVIVNKEGKDIFQCSIEADRAGHNKAIEPGEPADLCRTDFVPLYRKLGREKMLAFLTANPDVNTPKMATKRLKEWEKENTPK